ncbi:MAG: ATP-binding protein, partial [bacterium]
MSQVLREESAQRRDLQAQLLQSSRLEAMGNVAAKVAHDFNNMLTIIVGYGGMLLRRLPAGHEARADVEEIARAGERATAICRQLLAFSRGQILAPVPFDLNAWLAESEGLFRRLAGERAAVALQLGADAPWVKADPGQLTQAVTNLVANARDAMAEGGTITVGTSNVILDAEFVRRHPAARTGAHVELWVADSGHGMDEATLARMFEPFFTTKAPGKGTGLGLASVHGIVQQSGGYVWAESAVGRGTTFRICLPRVEARPGEPVARPAAAAPVAVAGTRVLLVDDEDAVRGFAKRALEAAGYSVIEAANGPEALRVAEGHAGGIPMLVTDAVMPSVSGFELARRLGAVRPGVRVLVISGYTNDA